MPGRKVVLANGQIYHVLNRGVASQPTFINKRNYERAIELMSYYQNQKIPLKYSQFVILSGKKKEKILENLKKERKFLVELIAYCLMPNHFHLILRQIIENGISKYMSDFTNSYTRYFNIRNERNGPLFQGKFKAIRVESDEQFLHLTRYIHLNPYSSYVVKTVAELEEYPYSSLPEHLGKTKNEICDKSEIINKDRKPEAYKKFVFDQSDYQRRLDEIKHIMLEK